MTTAIAELLPTSEAARVLGLSAERLRQLTIAGAVPSVVTRIGNLYDRGDLERFAVERERQRAERTVAKTNSAEFRGSAE